MKWELGIANRLPQMMHLSPSRSHTRSLTALEMSQAFARLLLGIECSPIPLFYCLVNHGFVVIALVVTKHSQTAFITICAFKGYTSTSECPMKAIKIFLWCHKNRFAATTRAWA
jgi:hypothetical protein